MIIPTLMYHSISPEGRDDLTVSPGSFARQVAYLAARYSLVLPASISLEGGVGWVQPATAGAAQPLCISFDDGLRDNLIYALPVLEKYNAPAVFFVITGYLGQNNAWNHRAYSFSEHMAPSDLKALVDAGHEVGSHTVTHQRLGKLSDELLDEEMAQSAIQIKDLTGKAPVSFAYPYGDASDHLDRPEPRGALSRVAERIQAACLKTYRWGFASARQGGYDWMRKPGLIRRVFAGPEDTPDSLDLKIRDCLENRIWHAGS